MNTLFIVGSAIHTKHGQFTAEQRLEQTKNTLQSITLAVPSAKIILNESSAQKSLSDLEIAQLSPYFTVLATQSADPTIQKIYQSTDNYDIVKSYTELVSTIRILESAVSAPDSLLNDADRVFKLSGRYTIDSDFDLTPYENPALANKYIFAARRYSQFSPQITNGLQFQLMSRLWSWPAKSTGLVLARYQIMLEDFGTSLDKGQYRDIEHLLFKYFEGPNLHEFAKIGVTGQVAPTGQTVKD